MGRIAPEVCRRCKSFRAHGILTKDGGKMSKSKGNVVNPDEVFARYGADTLRLYLMFIGPYMLGGDYSDQGIKGCKRFLKSVWDLVMAGENDNAPEAVVKTMHRSIKKVGEDIEKLEYNTAISQLMILRREMADNNARRKDLLENLLILLSPFAPFITEELWEQIGHKDETIFDQSWPKYEDAMLVDNSIKMAVQVNGKVRGQIEIPRDMDKGEVEKIALENETVKPHLIGDVKKVIVVPNRIVNIVVK